MEVLEAVHLLLAFSLFVVVVGVDVRWVSQALQQRYPKQLGHTKHIASPTDYLEKVFQIPFWLPEMDQKSGRRLLELALTGVTVKPRAQAPNEARMRNVEDRSTENEKAPAAEPEGPRSNGKTAGSSREARVDDDPIDPTIVAAALTLEERERERLLEMAQAIGISPRRAKRFANLYRLIKASLSVDERKNFVIDDGEGGSYVGALLLLAAATGSPKAALEMIENSKRQISNPTKFLKTLVTLKANDLSPDELTAFEAVKSLIENEADKRATATSLQYWGPGVSRFLFDQG